MVEDTLSRWIKSVMAAVGINTAVFAAHSTRSAATSAAARHGAPLDVILQAGNWQHAGTFAKFYNRDISTGPDSSFPEAVLHSV